MTPGLNGAMGALMWMPLRPPRLGTLLAWHPQPIPVLPVLCLVLWLAYTAGVVRLRAPRGGLIRAEAPSS